MSTHTHHRMDDASLAAFASLDLPDRQSVVIRAFSAGSDALTDRDVAARVGAKDMNQVRPRITELLEVGVLVATGRAKCPATGKTVRTCRLAKPGEAFALEIVPTAKPKACAPDEIITGTIAESALPYKALVALMLGNAKAAEVMGMKSVTRRDGDGRDAVLSFVAVAKSAPTFGARDVRRHQRPARANRLQAGRSAA